jgi:hypothetical protein
MTESKITSIDTLFSNVYRLTLENKMIIDIYETESPKINSLFIYKIYEKNINTDSMLFDTDVYMSGKIYKRTDDIVYISFGGLLCSMPTKVKFGDDIGVSYKITNPLC